MILTLRIKIAMVVFLLATLVVFLPEFLAYRQHQLCEHSEASRARIVAVAYQASGPSADFRPCFVDGEMPLWQKSAVDVWLGLLFGIPLAMVRRWFMVRKLRA